GDRLVYFVDGLNKDRVINIDKVQLSDDIESISIVPIYDYSDSLDYEVLNNGNLLSGEYYILIEYVDGNGGRSFYKNIINGIPIERGDYNVDEKKVITDAVSQGTSFLEELKDYDEVRGTVDESRTDKSIIIHVNLNNNFSNLNIYIAHRYEGVYNVYLKEEVYASGSINISSLNDFILLDESVSDIITPNILYSKSSSITQIDNRLIMANTSTEGYNIDFQEFANNIKVGYEIELEAFAHNYEYGENYTGTGA